MVTVELMMMMMLMSVLVVVVMVMAAMAWSGRAQVAKASARSMRKYRTVRAGTKKLQNERKEFLVGSPFLVFSFSLASLVPLFKRVERRFE
jgi:outer membrane lipoprotein-sorting protein